MKAIVKTRKGDGFIELRDVPEPSPGEGEVLIEIKAAGVCKTDIHILHDHFPYWPPVILGHEFSGEIVEAGSGVTAFKVGDGVVGEPHTKACGKCCLCRTGRIQLCPQKRSPGWGIDGAFAGYIVMPEMLLHGIPEGLSFDHAALAEPAANVIHDVLERARVEPSDFVVVMGVGPIGLLAAMAVKACGARRVAIVGVTRDEELRFKIARKVGIDLILNAEESDPARIVLDETGGQGADLVVEASGAEPAIAKAVEIVRKCGRISVVGLSGKDRVQFPWDAAQFKACDVYFNLSTSYTSWDRALGLIATGRIEVEPLITHREPLENWEAVFDDIESGRGIKALFVPE